MLKIVLLGSYPVVHFLGLALRRQQCQVQAYCRPFAALSFLEQLPRDDGPDLILVQFPFYGMDNTEVIHYLRRCASCQRAQICLLTDCPTTPSERLLQLRAKVECKRLPVDVADLLALVPEVSQANRQRPVA